VGERQPGLEVVCVREPAVELREAWIGIARVVPDGAHPLECRLDGEVLTAVILIKASREGLRTLGPQLADVDGVSEVYTVTGEWDFVAIIRVREHDELASVVTGRLAALEGIAATNTMVAFQQFSAHDLESMFGLGLEA
jgi:DNA-binding Lrp family transcriptional regulator